MTKPICIDPIVYSKPKSGEQGFDWFINLERAEYINEVKAYEIIIEATGKCPGACAYCYSSSTDVVLETIPYEKIICIVDEAKEMGVKEFCLYGGEFISHPNYYEIMSYAADQGFRFHVGTSGIISKKAARQLFQFQDRLNMVGVHLDTIDPALYAQVHTNPRTLELKIQGYKNLLETGFKGDEICGCITLTKASITNIEETIDWYVDEMGCKTLVFVAYKDEGLAAAHHDWEPALSDIKRTHLYRAKKLGDHWLRIGTGDGTKLMCRGFFCICYNGDVAPCPVTRDLVAGNIYKESLKDIFNRSRDSLLFNFKIKGPCGECENSDICFGCRGTAYKYTGDMAASDPRCWQNPEAKEHYYL